MTLTRLLNYAVRQTLAPFDLEIERANPFGRDPLRDVRTLASEPLETAFDVGANEGQTALRMRQIFSKAAIHCFEPSSGPFKILQQNLERDPLCYLVPKALGDCVGYATLHENESSVTNSLLPNAPGAASFQPAGKSVPVGRSEVEVITIDAYCAENRIRHIDLLKIDSQGFELKILAGAETMLHAQGISFLLLEVLFDELYSGQAFFHEIYERLRTRGYRLVGLYEINRGRDAHISWCDALFCRASVRHA